MWPNRGQCFIALDVHCADLRRCTDMPHSPSSAPVRSIQKPTTSLADLDTENALSVDYRSAESLTVRESDPLRHSRTPARHHRVVGSIFKSMECTIKDPPRPGAMLPRHAHARPHRAYRHETEPVSSSGGQGIEPHSVPGPYHLPRQNTRDRRCKTERATPFRNPVGSWVASLAI